MLLRLFDTVRHKLRSKALTKSQANGARAEDLAMRFLQKRRFTILARNYRAGFSEIDIVARHGEQLVFVEVKSAESDVHSTPDRAIDSAKRAALERAARAYSLRAQVPWEKVRFDIVTVVGLPVPEIQHFPAAW